MMPVAGSIANEFLATKGGGQPPFAGRFAFIFLLTWQTAKHKLTLETVQKSPIKP
jgi:hypothetical protein